jgi:pimeloyl-ACP methyl ester carboxylesterase
MAKIARFSAGILLASFSFAVSAAAGPNWTMPDGVKWIEVNGYPMSYQDKGQGTPLVLVHGSANDYRTWATSVPVLATRLRVINVSLRHFFPERWDGTGTDFSIAQHAGDVAQFIKTLNLGKVHLLGHSRGGAVVAQVAKNYPELIRTLILEDGSIEMPVEETAEAKEAAEFTKRNLSSLRNGLKSGNKEKATAEFLEVLNGPGSWERTPEFTRQILFDNIYTVLGDDAVRPVLTCDDVRKFQFPTLLMTGENSPKKYEFFYNEMRKCARFEATVIIPKAAHGMHRQNPEAFNAAVLQFASMH